MYDRDVCVNDQAAWEQALSNAGSWYCGVPAAIRLELDGLLEEIMHLKQMLVELVTSSGSSAICRACGGECCNLGKYHLSVLDILAYRKTGLEPLVPDFSSTPACPYSNASGCLMTAPYRPLTCVIFNCQSIEERLTAPQRQTLDEYESALRATVARAGRLHDMRIDRPLLLSYR